MQRILNLNTTCRQGDLRIKSFFIDKGYWLAYQAVALVIRWFTHILDVHVCHLTL